MPRAFPQLAHPIVQAPMAGGPSTPALAGAVSGAGALGFLAAGYRSAEQLQSDIDETRSLTDAAFGVNLFCLTPTEVDQRRLDEYALEIEPEASRHQVGLGTPHFEDDGFEAKLELVRRAEIPIVSFTFGCPERAVIASLQAGGAAVWVTVTEPDEARQAASAGADAIICQGVEAGGHRSTFIDVDGRGELGLLALLGHVQAVTDLPLVASGGIADGRGIAEVLAAGARAAQIGTGFLLCPEAATSAPHRAALKRPGTTALTRAFSGRRARGIVNRFMREHGPHAPAAYPHVNQLTSPLRAAARAAGDADAINLWAGEGYPLAQERPAAELVGLWSEQARALG